MKKTILFVIFFCIIGFSLCSLAEGNYGVNLSSAAYQPASSGGSNVFSEGQCTWYAWGRAYEKGMSFYWGNGYFGNACDWYKNAKVAGYHCEATPRSNSIAVWEAENHVAFVESVDGNIIYISEGNHYYNGAYLKYAEAKINTTNGFYELTYGYGYSSVNQKYTGSSPVYLQNPNNEPYGSLDLASGSKGTIRVAGWAKDDDSPDQSLSIHVYVGGPAGSGAPVYAIKANGYRPDIGGNYAYDDIIAVSPFGAQKVYVYAIDTNNGSNPCIGEATVNIERDTSAPVISNIVVSDISSTGYRVTCNISDDVKISKVQFPTWTDHDGQDDIDVLAVLSAVGGFDIAAMCGAFLGAALKRMPVVIDGYISAVAALAAFKLNPASAAYMIPSHRSYEAGYNFAMEAMGLKPFLELGMRLGEGSGCPLAFEIVDAACYVLSEMKTLSEASVDGAYLEELKENMEESFG